MYNIYSVQYSNVCFFFISILRCALLSAPITCIIYVYSFVAYILLRVIWKWGIAVPEMSKALSSVNDFRWTLKRNNSLRSSWLDSKSEIIFKQKCSPISSYSHRRISKLSLQRTITKIMLRKMKICNLKILCSLYFHPDFSSPFFYRYHRINYNFSEIFFLIERERL